MRMLMHDICKGTGELIPAGSGALLLMDGTGESSRMLSVADGDK